MALAETFILSLTELFTEKLMDKIFELAKDKLKIAFEVKYFAFSNWTDDNGSTALVALVEVTNTSEKPLTISEFDLFVGENKFRNVNIAVVLQPAIQGTIVEITAGNKERVGFELDIDFFEPLGRPYLRINESKLGLIIFKLKKGEQLKGGKLSIGAKVAGHDMLVTAEII